MTVLNRVGKNLLNFTRLGPTFPLRHISGLLRRKYHVATIKRAGKVYIRPRSSDSETFVQVFQERQYDLAHRGQYSRVLQAYETILHANKVPIIIDAGANVGAASIWFSREFPDARVFAVEPDVGNAEVCRLNTRELPNVAVIEAAIGSERGRVSLTNRSNQEWAVQTMRNLDGKVRVVTVADLVSTEQRPAKIFLVKIDIEGFEDDLFARSVDWVGDAEVIIVEPHDWLFPGKGTSRNFQKVMGDQNFEVLISGENLVYIRLPPGDDV